MSLDDALHMLHARYNTATREAESDGNEELALVYGRRRDAIAGLIGNRTRTERLRIEAVRRDYADGIPRAAYH